MQGKAYIQEIIEWAKAHDNHISYVVVADMLKSKDKELDITDDMESVLEELADAGIVVENSEESEDYGQEDVQESGIYIPADVHITPRNITIDIIQDRLKNNEIDMQPAFQRRGGLWSEVQQSRLIESLMLNIPIPTFYFDARDEEKWVVIDGLQRLTTLYKFMVSGKLKLQGLEYLTEFNGCGFKDLPRQYYRRIRETQIQIYTIEKGTPERIVFNIFKRINTGGLHLEPQEIRHALYSGKATELIEKLAGMPCFKKATGHAIFSGSHGRMHAAFREIRVPESESGKETRTD